MDRNDKTVKSKNYMYTLKPLPYSNTALSPYLNEETLLIHHGKHHQAYVTKLNELLAEEPQLAELSLEELISRIDEVPEAKKQAVFNNAGQVFNHDLYWQSMKPNQDKSSNEVTGEIAELIAAKYPDFKKSWKEAGIGQFGSGWVWLSVDKNGNNLMIEKTSNADNPLFHGRIPLLTMDVWEHAYYLDYQNKRPDYIDQFFNLIDWEGVNDRLKAVKL